MTEILGTGCSTLRLARSEGIQLVDLTGVFQNIPRSRGLSEHGGIFLRRVLELSPHARVGIPMGGGLW